MHHSVIALLVCPVIRVLIHGPRDFRDEKRRSADKNIDSAHDNALYQCEVCFDYSISITTLRCVEKSSVER